MLRIIFSFVLFAYCFFFFHFFFSFNFLFNFAFGASFFWFFDYLAFNFDCDMRSSFHDRVNSSFRDWEASFVGRSFGNDDLFDI